jgi:hypothetical protein
MSLPVFSTQAELFSTTGLSAGLFGPTDRFRLFALKVFPVLAGTRTKLEGAYCPDNGRVALEPVLLLGVSLLQYLEGVPDRQAVELLPNPRLPASEKKSGVPPAVAAPCARHS